MNRTVKFIQTSLFALFLLAYVHEGALAWKLPFSFSLPSGDFHPRVNASIDEKRQYRLSFLVALPNLSPARSDSVKEYITEKCMRFTALHKNIRISPSFYSSADAVALLRQSIKRKSPPDIAFLPARSFMYFGDLQIPIGRYMTKNETDAFGGDALTSVSHGNEIIGWPIGYRPCIWAVRPDMVRLAGLDPDKWIEGRATLGELAAALAKANSGVSWGLLNNSFLDSIFCGRKPAKQSALWHPADMASGLNQLALYKIRENPLESFLTGKTAALAPVNERLQEYLMDTLGDSGQVFKFFPAPVINKPGIIASQTDCIALFRQAEFKGHDQLKAGAEFLRFFSRDSGALCRMTLAIPCTKGAKIDPAYSSFESVINSFVCESAKTAEDRMDWELFAKETALPAVWQILEGKGDGTTKLIKTVRQRLNPPKKGN